MITRYEIAARHPDGRAYLIGYSPRVSRIGLLNAIRKHGEQVIAKLEIGEAAQLTFGTRPRPFAITGEWRIEFTGRTQVDCRSTGALPFIAA